MTKHKLPLILTLAFLLRGVGIGFGLPRVYHQDEAIIVNHAMAIGVGGWNPHFFVLPPLAIYVLFIVFAGLFAGGKLAGLYPDAQAFGMHLLSDPTPFYLAGRATLGLLPGVASVWLVYRIARRVSGEKGAVVAALLMATAFLTAAHGHYIYADGPLVLFLLMALEAFLKFFESGKRSSLVSFSVAIGLAVASKYTAVYFLPAYLTVYFLHEKRTPAAVKMRASAVAAVLSIIVFAVAAPFTFLDWTSFLTQIRSQSGAQGFTGFGHHLTYSLANGLGWPTLLAALAGLLLLFRERPPLGWLLALQGALYYGVNVLFGQPFARYMLPLVPIACVLAGHACQSLRSPAWGRALILVMVVPNLTACIYLDALFSRQDTRDLCETWIAENVPNGAVIVRDNRFFAPHLTQTADQLRKKADGAGLSEPQRRKLRLAAAVAEKKKHAYEIYTLRDPGEGAEGAFPAEKPYVLMEIAAVERTGARYLIRNYSTTVNGEDRFLGVHGDRFERIASFSPFRDPGRREPADPYSLTSAPDSLADLLSRRRLGPYLEVYRIKNA